MAPPNQIQQINAGINFKPDDVYIIQCVGVHNEADWLPYCVDGTYKEFDKIIIVEGAVKGRPKSTEDGHSTDDTLEIARHLTDPDNKIEIITRDDHWASLEEQKQVFLDRAAALQEEMPEKQIWIAITDADEMYHPEDIQRYRKGIELKPFATEFVPTFLHFWRDFHHVVTPSKDWNITHQRFFRYQFGMRYNAHPIASDAQGQDTCLGSAYQPFRFQIPGLHIYHYGAAKPLDFQKEKLDFYKKELAQHGKEAVEDAKRKYKALTADVVNSNDVLEFTGKHPPIMDSHLFMLFKDKVLADTDAKPWRENRFYQDAPIPLIFHYYYFRDEEDWLINPLDV